jgi:hypothetical protein
MNHVSVKRSTVTVAAFSCAILLAACEDKRVSQLDTGISRDSALSVISHDIKPGTATGPDSFPNVYMRARYLIKGKNFEVLYFTPTNEKIEKAGKDTIPLRKLSPIVFVDNRLIGRGWDFWDSVAAANRIQVPPKK